MPTLPKVEAGDEFVGGCGVPRYGPKKEFSASFFNGAPARVAVDTSVPALSRGAQKAEFQQKRVRESNPDQQKIDEN